LKRHGICPFPAERLDESLGLAVGSGRVGPGADVPQTQGAAGLGKRFGDVGRAVVAHHPPAFDPLTVEPGDCPAEKADHRWLLLIRQHLDRGQPGGVIHGDMDLVVADAVGAALLPVSGDAVAHLPKPSQGLDVNVDQVSWPLPLVALHRWFGFQVPQSPQPQTAESPGNGGERCLQQPGDVPEVEPLVAEIHGVLQLLRIERPPLGAANTPTIRQRGWTT
jgi:hypothetical protein